MTQMSSTGIPLKDCTLSTCPLSDASLDYIPNLGGNVFYMALFLLVLIAQTYFGIRHRTWSFLGGMIPGLLLEILGYVGRILLHKNPFDKNSFILYLVCLTIAPAFITASIYLCLSRIVTVCGTKHSHLSPRKYTIIFICCDIISLLLQSAGGALASTAKNHSGSLIGVHIMVAGLAWQVISMVVFLGLWGDFALRAKKARTSGDLDSFSEFSTLRDGKSFRLFQISLFTATIAIFIRSIYRVAELQGGFSSKIANSQATFMIFEGPFMILAVTLLTIFHPGRIFDGLWVAAGQTKTSLSKDSSFALQNQGEVNAAKQRVGIRGQYV